MDSGRPNRIFGNCSLCYSVEEMMHPLTVFSKYCGVIAIFPFMLLLMCLGENASGGYTRQKGPQAGRVAWFACCAIFRLEA